MWAIHQGLGRGGMEIHQDHVRPCNDALGRGMHDITDAVRRHIAGSDGMGRIHTDGHPGEPLHHRDMGEVHKVSMRVAHAGLDAPQRENDIPVAFTGQVLGGIQAFIERDPEAPLEEDRIGALTSHGLEEFEVLGIPGADLEHDAGRISRRREGLVNLLYMGFVGYLHGNHLDAILAGQVEHPWQARGAVALEGVGAGPRFVCTHPCGDLTVFLEGLHHLLDVLRGIHGAQPGKDVQGGLAEGHAIVREASLALLVAVTAQYPVGFLNPDGALHTRKTLHGFLLQGLRIAQQIDFGQRLLGTLDDVGLISDVIERVQMANELGERFTLRIRIRLEDQDHGGGKTVSEASWVR